MQPPFAITIEQFGDTAVVGLTGELDTTRCAEVDDALSGIISEGRVHLIIDVTGLTFCDSMGLRTFLEFAGRATKAGGWLRLAGVHGVVKRLLEVTGVAFAIPMDPDVPTAMQARIA
ncbi:STAS domain-containing protein [Nonomuraea sp. LPB2021202275-12-8]|uniref:STAS domain-containing protein n=1 Tax=Nonomuraea sp. LPB2021202275-12-8 TaxID=3120159 RepID=UPI00300D2E07